MRRTAALGAVLLLMLGCGPLRAQEGRGLAQAFGWGVRTWNKLIGYVGYDTTYLYKPPYNWTVKGRMNLSERELSVSSRVEGRRYESKLSATRKETASLGLGWQGLSGSLSLNPDQLRGRYRDYEWSFSAYFNIWGIELLHHQSNSFEGTVTTDDSLVFGMPGGIVSHDAFSFAGYYVFNARRFSYPAAFSQSFVQKRSCGSWIAALSFQRQEVVASDEPDPRVIPFCLNTVQWGVGGGYGYNWVPFRGMVLHVSATPTFQVYSDKQYTLGDYHRRLGYYFPEVIIVSRGAVAYQWEQWFVGAVMVFDFSVAGNEANVEVRNMQWTTRMFVGFRF